MDLSLLRHQSDSRFCFSINEKSTLIRVAVSKLATIDKIELIWGDPRSFHSTHYSQLMVLKHEDVNFRYYETIVNLYPMRLMYVFAIIENGNTYYYSESGITEKYIFDSAFINSFQFIGENYIDHVKENPKWKGRVIYQIFPERFASSDKLDKSYVTTSWYNDDLKNNRNAFIGGDLYGIIDKLDYLKELGVGALYLTPIHPSDTNHKYDVKDYFDIDPHFGGKEAFKLLVEKAHDNNILIMMDMVFNHMSKFNEIFVDVEKNGRKSKYFDWFFINGDYPSMSPLNYLCFGRFPYMPKLNTNNIEVQDYLIKVGEYYLKEFDIDGYRLDVSEGVSHDFWTKFKIAMKKINPYILVIGENWFNSESYLGNNQFDGVMNYPFLDVISNYICKLNSTKKTAESLDGLLMRYKDGHNHMMMNVLSTHDIQRIYNLASMNIDVSLLAYAIMVFFIGYPLVYYGDEIFMEGSHDPDNRRGMKWNSPLFNSKEHKTFKALINLRREAPLREGDILITTFNDLLKIKRMYLSSGLTLYCNMNSYPIKIEGNVVIANKYNGNMLEPDGFVIVREYR